MTRFAERGVAESNTLRGLAWTLFIGVEYYLMSNPIALMGDFATALHSALIIAGVFFVLQVPWIKLPRPSWPLVAFLGYGLLTWFWSLSPSSTLAEVRLYVVLAVMAALCAANVDVVALGRGITCGGLIVLGASFYAAYLDKPGVRIPAGGDGWLAGVGTNANILGYTLVPALATVLAVLPRTRWGWLPWSLSVVALGGGVVLAYSGTSMLAAVVVTVLAMTMHAFRWIARSGRWRLRAGIIAPLVLALPTYLLVNAVLLGRDVATLDGRVAVWTAAIETSRPALLWGNGWGAVWSHTWLMAPLNPVVERIYARTGIGFTHGHNSFIDPLPEVGLIGVALLLACHVWAAWWAISYLASSSATTEQRDTGRLVLCLLVALLVLGVSEPMSMVPLGWFLLVIALTRIACTASVRTPKGRRAARGRRRSTPPDEVPAAATPPA